MWGHRFKEHLDDGVRGFLASVSFDKRLAWADIAGSVAHATMLGETGVISKDDSAILVEGLRKVWSRMENEAPVLDPALEDIHMNVEYLLKREVGTTASCLHAGRSRNDQVALDLRIYMRERVAITVGAVVDLQTALLEVASSGPNTCDDLSPRALGDISDMILQGHTHLQGAQPVLMAHLMLAHFEMLQRDIDRLKDTFERINVSPLGAGALAGTGLATDPDMIADMLGFRTSFRNSLDAVSDRDFVFETLSDLAILSVHLSGLCEEVILWCTKEFGWAKLGDQVSTGSSMMPQKRNPDIFELVRGRSGRLIGHVTAIATMLKGLPLAYNKDLQEDKEMVFDAFDTIEGCLKAMVTGMKGLKFVPGSVIMDPSSYATDLCEHLVKKGVPFRDAYGAVGRLVQLCEERGISLDQVDLQTLKGSHQAFDEPSLSLLTPEGSVGSKVSPGGTGPSQVAKALTDAWTALDMNRAKVEELWEPTKKARALLQGNGAK